MSAPRPMKSRKKAHSMYHSAPRKPELNLQSNERDGHQATEGARVSREVHAGRQGCLDTGRPAPASSDYGTDSITSLNHSGRTRRHRQLM